MSLPTIEPLPDENTGLPSGQRRRRRRMVIPPGASERGKFLHDLSLRTVPTFDFYLFSLLAGLVLVAALLLDSPALFVLGALIAPFMAPAVGIALGTIAGAIPFVLQSLGSLLIGSLIVFLCGLRQAGQPISCLERAYTQAACMPSSPGLIFLFSPWAPVLASFLYCARQTRRPLVGQRRHRLRAVSARLRSRFWIEQRDHRAVARCYSVIFHPPDLGQPDQAPWFLPCGDCAL